jgi:hypothetical protein
LYDDRVRPQAEATFCAKQTLPSNWEKATCVDECNETVDGVFCTGMHGAAVRRDVREVVEGRTCVKIHSLPVTGVSLRATDPSYASIFDQCDSLGTKTSTLQTGRWTNA